MKFDDAALTKALGGKPPPTFDRAARVALLAEAFQALIDGRLPSRQAALFLGGAGMAWLSEGGDFAKDFLRVTKPKSRHTASYLWREMQAHQDERQDAGDGDTILPLDDQGSNHD